MASSVKTLKDVTGQFFKTLRALDGVTIRSGVFGNNAAEDRGGITQGELADVHEFGTKDGKIPSRSFMRSTFDERQREWGNDLDAVVGKSIRRLVSPVPLLQPLASKMTKAIKDKIRSRIPPPLSETTPRGAANEIPLIDTGSLIDSIKTKVEK